MEKPTCEECGKRFQPAPTWQTRGARFCSQHCRFQNWHYRTKAKSEDAARHYADVRLRQLHPRTYRRLLAEELLARGVAETDPGQ